ncbi:MAG: alpha/beta hydrolase [Cellvibrionaceae bacterium]
MKRFLLPLFCLCLISCGGNNSGEATPSVSPSAFDTNIKSIDITTSEGVFDGLTAGPTDGTPVILLHGFPTTADQYTDIIKTLAAEGYYVIAPNQRGFAPEMRPSNPEAYHPSLRTQDVIDMANTLGIYRFHLAGHDSGALTAWILAAMYPDRVITLTAMSVPHPQAIIDNFFANNDVVEIEREGYVADFTSEGFEETFVANDHEYMRWIYEDTPQDSIDLYVEKLGDVETVDAILNYYRTRDWTWILTYGASAITVPTLQIWGDADSYVSISSMERSEGYVVAEYHFEILEGVSHWVTETAADDVSALMLVHLQDRY